jgi:hypothetical protein
VIFLDTLRPPAPFDPSASAYKDWLHLNVFDHSSGSVGIINVSLHGALGDPCSRAVGTGLAHVPRIGWVGNTEVRALSDAAFGEASIGLERIALAAFPARGEVVASIRNPEDGITARLTASASASPVIVEEHIPLGPGWISWYAVPRLALAGNWTIKGKEMDLQGASAYHDHNWGRWHWGDDLGWEWGCFQAPASGPTFVMCRTTDRAHHQLGKPWLIVHAGEKRRTFTGSSVEMDYDGELETVLRRLPGAMAALHQDWVQPHLPKRLQLRASDGIDHVALEFVGFAAAQVVTADPIQRGYGFIHEIVGEFTCSGRLGRTEVAGAGLGVLEHVD